MSAFEQLQAALADRYTLVREIGAGGMATVFLARDSRHSRHVALKLLKPELGAVLGVERFLSEIRVTANLQHPHLLPLFDSGQAEGMLFYVMPFVEGESLRARLDREKQLPVDEAIRLTVAVAGALDYAHRHNVVHRDLKPENILLHDGQPLVADFGIALAVSNAGGTRVTQTGLSLGTPQYMSPEQATGDRVIDARSDIYSLGAVLYEMLTGEPPHTGATVQAIIARVLTDRPRGVRAVRETVPEHVERAIERALAKVPADRFSTAREFAEALQNPVANARTTATRLIEGPAGSASAPRRAAPRSAAVFVPWILAAAGLAAGAWGLTREPVGAPAPPIQFRLELPEGASRVGASALAISPRGDAVVMRAQVGGRPLLVLQRLGEESMRVLQGTAGGGVAFFSPDGKSLGFVSNGRLQTMSLDGGNVTTIAEAPAVLGGAWGNDGQILLGTAAGLLRVSASGGGKSALLSRVDSAAGEGAHLTPSVVPESDMVLFASAGSFGTRIATVTRDGKIERTDVSGFQPQWLRSGHVLFSAPGGVLLVAPFDLKSRRFTGEASVVMQGLRTAAGGLSVWSATPDATIVAEFGQGEIGQLVEVDRTGRAAPLLAAHQRFRLPRRSPDGRRIAIEIRGEGGGAGQAVDLWMMDRRTGTLARITSDAASSDPLWTPNGDRLTMAKRDSAGDVDIYWSSLSAEQPPERLVTGRGNQWPWAWTPDGRTLIFDQSGAGVGTDIMRFDLGADSTPRPLVASRASERLAKISPDGRWLAYVSDESDQAEVYVRPFPGPGEKLRISMAGGTQPVWSPDGRELYYRENGKFVAAAIRTSPEFEITGRTALFDDRFAMSNATNYDVLPGGRGFLMIDPSSEPSRISVFVNWLSELGGRGRQD